MSYVATKGIFHVALNGIGLLLQGAPDRMGYVQRQAPVYGQRFASGDRDYNDLSQWWYFVQTDWSGGEKDTVSWADDAKYYWSTNIDMWSEPGAIKLARQLVSDEVFADKISVGVIAEVDGSLQQYVGTEDDSDNRPHVWEASIGTGNTWTDIAGTTFPTTHNVVSCLTGRNGYLFIGNVGTATTYTVATYDGSAWDDCTADIETGATLSHTPLASRAQCEYAGSMYIFVDNFLNDQFALVSTAAVVPTGTGDWALEFEKLNVSGAPSACIGFAGKILYLTSDANQMELWEWDIANSVNTRIRVFNGGNANSEGVSNKYLVEFNGKIIITIPDNEIWEYDGAALTRLYKRDFFKRSTLSSIIYETTSYLGKGCLFYDDKLWWGNLMYDGTNFSNTFKAVGDSASVQPVPLYADTGGLMWWTDSTNEETIYYYNSVGSDYKGTDNKNYLVTNNFDTVAGVEKLAYSMTLLFKPLATSQSIEIEYLLGEMISGASWTSLGSASASVDGTTVRSKTLFFTSGVIFNKIWFRIKLEGAATDTPTLNDIVMEYLPMPTYKKDWALNVNCADEVKTLAGRLVQTTGRELKGLLERSWWTKSTLDFQDFDYFTTLLNGSLTNSATTVTVDTTVDAPEQGRLKVDDEEMFYTGKTSTTFTGLIRGARGTRAVAHSDNAVINNAYKVLITDMQTRVPIANEDKELEYTVALQLREV